MKILVLLIMVAFVSASAFDYSRYDNFNIDEIISNERLMTAQVKCYLGTGRCTPEIADIKKTIPGALQNSCGECTEKQKILVARSISAVIEKFPEEWKKLNKLHNPDGKYDEAIKEFINKYANTAS
ncbi:ejaculatory bulb-specific protein 3-like [Maniola hyperantus]|uniref:ejaculatory bulb-specific protein 3-like n=1 Tax=Aphantopus hyperantus TaxID=2795564 RepID=UPI0015685AD9|nr:ejaculatory bulb-specific protein 3-like [Maniola hyperantus]